MERDYCGLFFPPRRFVRVFCRGDGRRRNTRENADGIRTRNTDMETEMGGPRCLDLLFPLVFFFFLRLVALLAWCMPLSFILFYSISVLCLARKGGQKWQGGGAARVRGPSEKGELGEGRRGGKD